MSSGEPTHHPKICFQAFSRCGYFFKGGGVSFDSEWIFLWNPIFKESLFGCSSCWNLSFKLKLWVKFSVITPVQWISNSSGPKVLPTNWVSQFHRRLLR